MLSLLHFLIPTAHAGVSALQPDTTPGITDPAPPDSTISGILTGLTNWILPILLLIAGILAVFYLVWAGIQYINASGDPAKAKQARGSLINAVIGIVLIVATYAIIKLAVGFGSQSSHGVAANQEKRPPEDFSQGGPSWNG